jgi:hypothetical protein
MIYCLLVLEKYMNLVEKYIELVLSNLCSLPIGLCSVLCISYLQNYAVYIFAGGGGVQRHDTGRLEHRPGSIVVIFNMTCGELKSKCYIKAAGPDRT